HKFVDWHIEERVTGDNPPETISFENIFKPDLYRIVGSAIPPVDTNLVKRYFDTPALEYIFLTGSEDLYTYQQLTLPSYGLVQERPLFNNISNGIGLFTSRNIQTFPVLLSSTSYAAFDTSSYTSHLHFHHF